MDLSRQQIIQMPRRAGLADVAAVAQKWTDSPCSPTSRHRTTSSPSLGADVVVDRSTDLATAIRSQLPDGAPGLIDTAALDALALPAVADGGGLVTLKGWPGPSERGIVIHPVASFGSATSTALFDRLRSQVQQRRSDPPGR